jgi:hypothetical protein
MLLGRCHTGKKYWTHAKRALNVHRGHVEWHVHAQRGVGMGTLRVGLSL